MKRRFSLGAGTESVLINYGWLQKLNNEDNEFNVEQHKDELASLKRLAVQFDELRKWLLNASLASLAFAFTVMFQIKKGADIPHPTLAAFAIGFLISAVIGAIAIRGRNELANFMGDAKGFFSLLPAIRDMMNKSPEIPDADKLWMDKFFDRAIDFGENKFKAAAGSSPYVEVALIAVEAGVLVIGLGSLCAYVWLYLFGK